MTDPIGTAQERELIDFGALAEKCAVACRRETFPSTATYETRIEEVLRDALQSRIAEVVELRDALVDARAVLAHGSSQSARFLLGKIDAALSVTMGFGAVNPLGLRSHGSVAGSGNSRAAASRR